MQYSKRRYFLYFLLLLVLEVGIAQLEGFIRHTMGDFFVVVLLYCLLRSCVRISVTNAAIVVLIFAFVVEFLQRSPILEVLGLAKYTLARIIFGATFSTADLIAYTLGILAVLLVEGVFRFRKEKVKAE